MHKALKKSLEGDYYSKGELVRRQGAEGDEECKERLSLVSAIFQSVKKST